MKLATYKDGSRDGHLVVVSHDLCTAHYASGIASRMQQVLDDWNFLSPQLEDLSATLNQGRARHAFAFDPRLCMAPLPRAFQRVQALPAGDARSHEAGLPVLQHGSGDGLLGPGTLLPALAGEPEHAVLQLAVLSGDIAPGGSAERALEGVRLLLLVADVAAPGGAACSLFAPVAVTPDELGPGAWRGGRATLEWRWRHGGPAPHTEAPGAAWAAGAVLAALAARGPVGAGCLASTGALAHAALAASGWRVEAVGVDGHSVFGAIEPGAAAAIGAPAEAGPAAEGGLPA